MALTGLQLTVLTRLALHSQVFACLCYQGIVIKHMCQHAQ